MGFPAQNVVPPSGGYDWGSILTGLAALITALAAFVGVWLKVRYVRRKNQAKKK